MIMGYLKRIIISLLLLSVFLSMVISIVYITLIYKPENIVYISDKIFDHEYTIEFYDADSEVDFFSSQLAFNEIKVKDSNNIILFEVRV